MENKEKELSLEELDKVTGGTNVQVKNKVHIYERHESNARAGGWVGSGDTINISGAAYVDTQTGEVWYPINSPCTGWVKASEVG